MTGLYGTLPKKPLMFWLFLLPLNAISDVVPESVLSDWGYEKNPHEKYMEDYCKVAETPVSSAYQGIRGLPKSKTDKDTFVHTDVGKYSDYIDAMLEKLEKHLISLEKSN